jgi:ER-bound oxygenase mpaB/B'/Rubber oxygenase, catalytic domain
MTIGRRCDKRKKQNKLAGVEHDPPSDAHIQREVVRIRCVDFPWDMTRALEFALFRTFASPRIGGLLFATGEFLSRAQRRYDDTDLLLSEIVENGYTSERGSRALARMNEIHGRFRIRNEDFLYVLSTFVLEPYRWLDRYGWRKLTPEERDIWFRFWMNVGARMGITGLPADAAALERYSAGYELEHFSHTPANEAVARGVIELFASWYPAPARPLVRGAIPALLDDAMCTALGIPVPSARRRRVVEAALRFKARLVRAMPRRTTPVLRCEIPRVDYRSGYTIEKIGPPTQKL